jgi:hypothetical protein
MSRAEIADRTRQHLAARLDLLRYTLDGSFAGKVKERDVQCKPTFFFSPEAVPSLCALLKQRLPFQAREVVARAEQICLHRFDLLGYKDLDYGPEIDWHYDLVNDKRSPRKAWFKINYLDFFEVGDSKIVWELNRHQHWITLAKAYRLTGHRKYATEIFSQWQRWHNENPYPIGINWASSLEVAFRSLSWIWVYQLLEGTTAAPQDFRTRWLHALGVNARHIERHLSTFFSPNTHLLGEAVALFFIGTLYPELADAKRWAQRGWKMILRQAEAQVRTDGLHFEQSTFYHVYALDFFLHARLLAAANQIPVPSQFDAAIQNMLNALCVLGRAGDPPQLGDDDGGRVFDPNRNSSEHMLDPLATGAVLFGRGDFKFLADGLREETIWLLGVRGVAESDRLPAVEPTASSTAFDASGIYAMHRAEGREQLVIDAGPQGVMGAGHGHADALSVTLNANGISLLTDRGSLTYSGVERNAFRGTGFHNTLQVDGSDQAEARGPFSWDKLPDVKVEQWVAGKNFDLFVGSHNGYGRCSRGVIHRRLVFSLKSSFWLVRDVVLGQGEHQLNLSWHFAPGLSVQEGSPDLLVGEGGPHLGIFAAEAHGWGRRVEQDWHAPVYGHKEPAQVLRFGTVAKLPAEFATLLLPSTALRGEPDSLGVCFRQIPSQEGVQAYQYITPKEEHTMFFAAGVGVWRFGVWTSDAAFLYSGKNSDGALQALICCGGSFVEMEGQPVISSTTSMLGCGVKATPQEVDVWSSDPDVKVNTGLFHVAKVDSEPVLTSASPGFGKGL